MSKIENIDVKEKRSQGCRVYPKFKSGLLVMIAVTDRRKMIRGLVLGGRGEFCLGHVV